MSGSLREAGAKGGVPDPIDPGPLRQMVVVGFLLLLGSLVATGHVLGTDRYAFSMFREMQDIDRIRYSWQHDDGTETEADPLPYLHGSLTKVGGRHRLVWEGRGETRILVRGVLKYMFWEHRPPATVRIRALVVYRLNGVGEMVYEDFAYPPEDP